jgi:hypothetical protein
MAAVRRTLAGAPCLAAFDAGELSLHKPGS